MAYKSYLDAQNWMGGRTRRNLTTEVVGILPTGTHEVEVTEVIRSRKFIDVVYTNRDTGEFIRSRKWDAAKHSYQVGERYEIRVARDTGGCIIEVDYAGNYFLLRHGAELISSSNVADIYKYIRNQGLKLSYLVVVEDKRINKN